MNRILIIVNTYFQLMVAISLRLYELKNFNVDILISDRSKDANIICEKIKKLKVFNNCYFAKINFVSKKRKNYLTKLMRVINCNYINSYINIKEFYYDYIYFYNKDILSITILQKVLKENKKVKVCRFEEGFGSYLFETDLGTEKIYNLIKRKKYRIDKLTQYYYCYNPDLMLLNNSFEFKTIPRLNRNDTNILNIFNTIFNFKEDINKYDRKYIFFEESFFSEGKDMDDLELVLKIAEIVGKDKLLVKLHPRTMENRFEKYGICTNKTIGIPWEVIQMNNDFSDKVFLTISSGSVLASRLYFNDNIKTYLLFNCTEKMSDMVSDKYFKYLDKLREKFGMDNFNIPSNKEEFFENLEKINKCKE